MTFATRALNAQANAILKANVIVTPLDVDAFALKPVPRAPKVVAPKVVAPKVVAPKVVASKPTRVKASVIASTPEVDVTPPDTFTTVSLAREYDKTPKALRAFVRRHIDTLRPLMTSQHVYPNAHRAQVLSILKLA